LRRRAHAFSLALLTHVKRAWLTFEYSLSSKIRVDNCHLIVDTRLSESVNICQPIKGGIMATFKQTAGAPKPHQRYAQMATAMRATGLNIGDSDFEKIDALLEKNRQNCGDFKDADPTDLSVANALRESNCMSQDFKDADPADLLVAGFLPHTKQVLVN
jgi:hypothetical protein